MRIAAMKNRHFFAGTLLLFAVAAGCAAPGTTPNGNLTARPVTSTPIPANSQLQKQINEIAAKARGRVGVAAMLLPENTSPSQPPAAPEVPLLVSLNLRERFPMQSVYK